MAGSSALVFPALQVRDWLNKMERQVILGSVWGSISNRMDPTTPIPNSGSQKVPDSVVATYGDRFRNGVQFVTIPSLDKLIKEGQGGLEPVEGNEEKPVLRFKRVSYNVMRKGITLKDGSVEGDLTDAYNLVSERTSLLGDYFSELEDYNHSRALLEAADVYLTEARYWTGDSITTPPARRRIHPVVLFRGVNGLDPENGTSGMAAWNTNQDTYRDAIKTKVTAQVASGTIFTRDVLDKMIWFASRNVRKLGWRMEGSQKVSWVIVISEVQADQLLSDTSAGNWTTLFKDAGARGMENRAISGVLGYYREALVIVSPRQPLFNTEATGAGVSPFQYITPWGDDRAPAVKASGKGTMEVAMCMGRTSLGKALVKKLDFNTQGKDYDFSKGFEARMSCGVERADFYAAGGADGVATDVVRPKNWSSFVYLTGTPTISF
jgi:hypothetical protein